MPQLYRLKISLLEPHYLINELHRIIEVRSDINFYELYQAIFDIFDRDNEHLWQFFVPRVKMDSFNKLLGCQEQIILPDNPLWHNNVDKLTLYQPNIALHTLNLQEKDYLYHWFDFGDDWVYRIRLEKITECNDDSPKITVIKKVGNSPTNKQANIGSNQQINDKQTNNNQTNNNQTNNNQTNNSQIKDEQAERELMLFSALMMMATGADNPEQEPVRWGELVYNGVADELVARGWIKPSANPQHIVRMTELGESVLVEFLHRVGVLNQR